MQLIVGKANIENYENTQRGLTNDSMDASSVLFTWKNSQGVVEPAIIVFEASDFEGGGGGMVEGMVEHGNEYHNPDFAEEGSGGLVDKGGVATTDGNGEATVSFNTAYGDTNYFIQLTSAESSDAIICVVKSGSKTVNGFTINSKDDRGGDKPNVAVYWCTGPYSNP